ncbi:L,D-transpeptidase [Polyangium sp. 6x1]|uniref:L,D-transpeptidase family protein n=1 Tax=Polyangium sp. 6x1 TaxID=3042689 RepID=UPI002482827B|nr:L,D-transpeptidase [Polyangium sp. 6x1]MDI1444314.1 L,D-transpeptidase [Polyangium sp. 6x1]
MPRSRPPAKRPLLLGALVLAAVALLVLFLPPSSLAKPASCEKPSILIRKKDAALDLLCGGKTVRTFSATFGAQPVGQKEREGDERTPEGVYRITSKSQSERFHRFLGISYPEPEDLARAKKNGIDKPGGGIGIHGTKPKLAALARAWIRLSSATGLGQLWGPTDGCIGLANEDVDVLYALVPVGTKVTIQP